MQPVNKISISPGNQKMGYIPSVSLPPIITCANGCKCAKKMLRRKIMPNPEIRPGGIPAQPGYFNQ